MYSLYTPHFHTHLSRFKNNGRLRFFRAVQGLPQYFFRLHNLQMPLFTHCSPLKMFLSFIACPSLSKIHNQYDCKGCNKHNTF